MMRWFPEQYNQAWDSLYSGCDEATQNTLDSRLDYLLDKGNQCRRPITAHLDDGIFELRAKNARALFYFGPERTIVFVHGIIKKTSKVSQADLKIAKKNRDEIQRDQGEAHDF